MLTQVTHVMLFVKNQDDALKFYTEKLGLKVHTDALFEGFRWLTLCPTNQPYFEIALMPAGSKEEQALIGKQGGDKPFLTFETDNCLETYKTLKSKGVTLHHEPKTEPWGVSFSFEDLYGTKLYVCQPNK